MDIVTNTAQYDKDKHRISGLFYIPSTFAAHFFHTARKDCSILLVFWIKVVYIHLLWTAGKKARQGPAAQ